MINGGKLKRMRWKFRMKERKRQVKGCVVSPWGYTMINTLRKEVYFVTSLVVKTRL